MVKWLDLINLTLFFFHLKLTDQKPLKSWSTRQSNPLTCQCVYDSHNEKYVGILNHKHLCEWSENEANLEDIKKKTVTLLISSQTYE